MESEAFFLYIIYSVKPMPMMRDDNGRELACAVPVVKRATLRRQDRDALAAEGFQFSRVHVDFDPTNARMGYVVVIHAQQDSKYSVNRQFFHFPGVFETEQEAQEYKIQLEKGDYRNWLVKKQQLHEITVQPVLIADI